MRTAFNFTLSDWLENLTLTGAASLNGTGNSLGNLISGNSGHNIILGLAGDDRLRGGKGQDTLDGGDGNDILDGGEGIDRMNGGAGDDMYLVDNQGDLVLELANGGTDLVRSSVSHGLRLEVENLTLLGVEALTGTGNAQNNQIIGNAGNNRLNGLAGNDTINGGDGNDILDGGEGNDILLGGAGADVFIFNGGNDRIVDFDDQIDRIEISARLAEAGATVASLLDGAFMNGTVAVLDFGAAGRLSIGGVDTLAQLNDSLVLI